MGFEAPCSLVRCFCPSEGRANLFRDAVTPQCLYVGCKGFANGRRKTWMPKMCRSRQQLSSDSDSVAFLRSSSSKAVRFCTEAKCPDQPWKSQMSLQQAKAPLCHFLARCGGQPASLGEHRLALLRRALSAGGPSGTTRPRTREGPILRGRGSRRAPLHIFAPRDLLLELGLNH